MNIVVLAGGISTERDVSLKTGAMIYNALKGRGHNAVLLDVFFGYEGDPDQVFELDRDWAAGVVDVSSDSPDIDSIKAMRGYESKSFFGRGVLEICSAADIVFIALHGENGEDGRVQAAFDLMGIRYTGTDYFSSAIAMDKAVSKEIFGYYDIPTPRGIKVAKGDAFSWDIYPAIVKACRGGSSIGVSVVQNADDMEMGLKEAFAYGDEVVIEQFIEGREFSVGVIEGKALPVIEIAPLEGFYDYKNKYQKGSAIETCPADLNPELTQKMQRIAERVFHALRIKTYMRVDFMLDKQHNIYCLEGNTLPGMTPTSLLPQEAQAAGIGFGELCELIIDISLKKYSC